MNHKNVILRKSSFTIYDDYTYRYDFWDVGEKSEWKIVWEGSTMDLLVKHEHENDFRRSKNEHSRRIFWEAEQIIRFNKFIEEVLSEQEDTD